MKPPGLTSSLTLTLVVKAYCRPLLRYVTTGWDIGACWRAVNTWRGFWGRGLALLKQSFLVRGQSKLGKIPDVRSKEVAEPQKLLYLTCVGMRLVRSNSFQLVFLKLDTIRRKLESLIVDLRNAKYAFVLVHLNALMHL